MMIKYMYVRTGDYHGGKGDPVAILAYSVVHKNTGVEYNLGWSICSPKEKSFNKKIGRRIAEGRLYTNCLCGTSVSTATIKRSMLAKLLASGHVPRKWKRLFEYRLEQLQLDIEDMTEQVAEKDLTYKDKAGHP